MKLHIEKIAIKNFYSFGNRWQEFDFKTGINLVVGHNRENSRSNGCGKSNLFEAIIFALFGKTTKDVTKPQVINWKNKKQCELKIWFSKGDDKFMMHRGLKPTILKVYKNDDPLDELSNSRTAQEDIEANILEIDFNTFISLLHCNSSTTQSIFNVPKMNKRQFIEKLFGLETYTELTKKANEKIAGINSKITDIERTLKFNEKTLEDLHEQNVKFEAEILALSGIITEINDVKASINHSSDDERTSLELQTELLTKKEKLESKIKSGGNKIDRLTDDITSLKSTINSFDTDEVEKVDDNELSDLKNKIEIKIRFIDSLDETLDELIEKKKQTEERIDSIKDEIQKNKVEIATLNGQLNSLPNTESLSEKTQCPTCMQDIDYETISKKVKKESSKYQKDIAILTEANEELTAKFLKEKKELAEIENDVTVIQASERFLETATKTVETLEYKKKLYEQSKKKIQEKEELKESLKAVIKQKKEEEEALEKHEGLLRKVESKLNEISGTIRNIEDLKTKLHELQIKEIANNEQVVKFQSYIDENREKEKTIKVNESDFIKEKKKYQTMIDYLDYIKKVCKDENVKQYAISNIVPFLNKQVNSYISEAGFPFYLKLDSWLEAEIKGPGIYDASFGNLSSGQQKTTNLAMMLAFQDIAKLQAQVFPDIIIYDEILDSAIDATTIDEMIKIIKKKQKEDDSKVFIISHRKEVNEIAFDNTYRIEMENGFSEVKQLQ